MCDYVSSSGAVPTLYRLIAACNRSLPHMEIMSAVVVVLFNLGRHPPSRAFLWTATCAPTLVKMLAMTQNARAGSPGQWLFARTACLLALLCGDCEERRHSVLSDDRLVRRLGALRTRLVGREKAQRKRQGGRGGRSLRSATSAAVARRARERFCMPEWRNVRGKRADLAQELESCQALAFLTDVVLKLPDV